MEGGRDGVSGMSGAGAGDARMMAKLTVVRVCNGRQRRLGKNVASLRNPESGVGARSKRAVVASDSLSALHIPEQPCDNHYKTNVLLC